LSLDTAQMVAQKSLELSPPVVVTGLSLNGVAISDIVYILTAVYLLIQIGVIVHRQQMVSTVVKFIGRLHGRYSKK
jgi:hypothetical protein